MSNQTLVLAGGLVSAFFPGVEVVSLDVSNICRQARYLITIPPRCYRVRIPFACGAGGGGGAGDDLGRAGGGGGGSGMMVSDITLPAVPLDQWEITVGFGGLGGFNGIRSGNGGPGAPTTIKSRFFGGYGGRRQDPAYLGANPQPFLTPILSLNGGGPGRAGTATVGRGGEAAWSLGYSTVTGLPVEVAYDGAGVAVADDSKAFVWTDGTGGTRACCGGTSGGDGVTQGGRPGVTYRPSAAAAGTSEVYGYPVGGYALSPWPLTGGRPDGGMGGIHAGVVVSQAGRGGISSDAQIPQGMGGGGGGGGGARLAGSSPEGGKGGAGIVFIEFLYGN